MGRDITFDAALIAHHPNVVVHAFDNTPVAAEFVVGAWGLPQRSAFRTPLLAKLPGRFIMTVFALFWVVRPCIYTWLLSLDMS